MQAEAWTLHQFGGAAKSVATRNKLVVPDYAERDAGDDHELSPGFPKPPASAASQASDVIDASSVISFSTTTE